MEKNDEDGGINGKLEKITVIIQNCIYGAPKKNSLTQRAPNSK